MTVRPAGAVRPGTEPTAGAAARKWFKVLDQSRCIGCHACTTACKSENDVPVSVSRTYVKSVDSGSFPAAARAFQVTRCNQCDDAPCVTICPTSAMYARPDGIVDFDKRRCIGCKACMAACPYDAIFINPEDHSAEKCNFCAHRIEVGLEPACVVVCPVEAIVIGDLSDPASRVARAVADGPLAVRRPEVGTSPKVFYRGASETTLEPLAAERPPRGMFAWAQQPPETGQRVNAGVPRELRRSSQAAAMLSYDVGHSVPWDWRVSLYTWTKGIAAGVYLVAAALVLFGVVDSDDTIWRWVTPVAGLGFLGVTSALLIWDLEHPGRFHYLFTRPQWSSWLVRGAVVLTAYGVVLCGHLVASAVDVDAVTTGLAVVGVPLAVLTAIYTGFLFAQATGRDLWQSPVLPLHLLAQAVLAGAAFLAVASVSRADDVTDPLGAVVAIAAGVHLALTAHEVARPHPTAHARLATTEMQRGRSARLFWTGAVLVAVGALTPLSELAALAALAGLLAHEHAYVQAAQAVPLA